MNEENALCYQVPDVDYPTDYLENINWENLTESDCNCSLKIFTWLPICVEKCAAELPMTSSTIIELTEDQILEIALPALLYLVVFLVGTVGNAMVIFVVNRFKRMRNVTNVFLASLSTADLCLIWFCVPIMFVKYMSHTWFMGRFACYSVHYIQQFTCFCSVLTMTMISFERYLAIAYPMRNVWLSSIGRAKKVILLIWLVAAVLAIPTAMRIDYQIEQDIRGERVNWCHRRFPQNFANFLDVPQSRLNRIYAVYQVESGIQKTSCFQLLLLIVFPVVTMSVCYARVSIIVYTSSKDRILLSQAIKKASVKRQTRDGYLPAASLILAVHFATRVAFSKAATDAVHFSGYSTIPVISNSRQLKSATTQINSYSNSKQKNRVAEANKKQIVQMLISIVVMYTVCWLPTIVDEMLTSFGYICRISNSPTLKHMRMGFHALTYCQSCINPILYAFISQNFRATFKSAYSRMKHRLQGVEEMRSRMGSCSSQSMLSTRNHHRIYGSSVNTLTVPGRSVITPNLSREVSQLSLCRPVSSLSFNRPRSSIAIDGPTTIRSRSPTEISRDSGRPRSPTDVSQCSRPRSVTRPRSPTTTSSVSISVPVVRSRTPTGCSDGSLKTPNRSRSPTIMSNQSNISRCSQFAEKDLLTVQDAVRPRTPPAML